MPLTAALDSALSGIRTSQAGIDVIARNVANASNPDYVRQDAQVQSLVIGGEGRGAELAEVRRLIDLGVQRDLRQASTSQTRLETLQDYLIQIDDQFGRPNDEASLAASVQELVNSLQGLSDTPESATARREVINEAEQLASDFNRLSNVVQDLRQEAEDEIAFRVDEVNKTLGEIRDLNDEIARRYVGERSIADLEDQRDALIDSLAEDLDIRVFRRPTQEVTIRLASGQLLLDETVQPLEFDRRDAIGPSNLYVPKDNGASGVGTINLPGSPAGEDLIATGAISTGRIGALVELRDDILVRSQEQLDELAAGLSLSLSTNEVPGQSGGYFAESETFEDTGFPLDQRYDTVRAEITIDGERIVLGPFDLDAPPGVAQGELLADQVQDQLQERGFEIDVVFFDPEAPSRENDARLQFSSNTISEISSFQVIEAAPILNSQATLQDVTVLAAPAAANEGLELVLDIGGTDGGPLTIKASDGTAPLATQIGDIQTQLLGTGYADLELTVSGNDVFIRDPQGREILVRLEDDSGNVVGPRELTRVLDPVASLEAPGLGTVNGGLRSSTVDFSNVLTEGDEFVVRYLNSEGVQRELRITASQNPDTLNSFQIGPDAQTTATNARRALEQLLPAVDADIQFRVSGGGLQVIDQSPTEDARIQSAFALSQSVGDVGLEGQTGLDLFTDGTKRFVGSNEDLVGFDQKVGFAARISVNSTVREDDTLLVRFPTQSPTIPGDATTGERAPLGDPERPLALLDRLTNATRSFDATFGLVNTDGATVTSVSQFAVEVVSFQADQVARFDEELSFQSSITDAIQRRFESVSGVNVDEELAELLILEKTFSASSRIMTTVEQLFDELINILR